MGGIWKVLLRSQVSENKDSLTPSSVAVKYSTALALCDIQHLECKLTTGLTLAVSFCGYIG